ncbi:hypothetical protein PIB30_095837 [Stylosanthes scabra]|uniref:Uncharacterized protein n=1 Tax=Stylosanthes scabra TaxID=79078 RepID=A0ABU6YTF9_9FABA|nr:hypothetical protein [Stylosanthes scabra]
MVKKAQPLFATQSCCIYKVPHEIRQSNEDAYTPVLVSIGPFHHGNPRLVTMEAHKQVYCQHFIQRSEASLKDLVSCVQQLEPQIRACYSEKIDLTADELVKVIFIDCCFVIEFFLRDEWVINDVIFSKPWMGARVMYDLILLENQVPLFVIDKIYNLAFNGLLPPAASSSIAHFTDLLRYFYLPPSHRIRSRNHELLVPVHGASELAEAGLKFMVDKFSEGCMLDLKYEYGILKIPPILLLEDWTEICLRNILALEHCHYPQEHYVFDFVHFISQLINTAKDVDTLVKNRIINNQLGDNKNVAELFRGLKRNIVVTSYNANYLGISQELDACYEHPWHKSLILMHWWSKSF